MTTKQKTPSSIGQESLALHASGRPGKIEIIATKPLITQRDLALAYSPGVAAPCLAIEKDPAAAYTYTAKGNLVAVISNGTAVLGLGNLGALASKPVMEGKSVLFKRFADIDSMDIELNTEDVDAFVNAVTLMEPTFGGINLEDIKAPECFVIEERLKSTLSIPVFHDDQHGTAIITLAALINALDITGRKIDEVTIVVNGAGAAAIACVELAKAYGVKDSNVILCDRTGVVYKGRSEGMNPWKERHAVATKKRTLAEALEGVDVFLGLSAKDALKPAMLKSMAPKPIVFACANPDPEIHPDLAREVRPDALIATGRSDFPNQVNNVLGFPYIFRGALDVQATQINDTMKIAAAEAIAQLAREDVPDEVADAYAGRRLQYGPEYIIPVPFDPRLIKRVPLAVALAAHQTNVARKPIRDIGAYEHALASKLDPTASAFQLISSQVKSNPKTVVFAEGEEEKVIRAAVDFVNSKFGQAILIGLEDVILANVKKLGLELPPGVTISNAAKSDKNQIYKDYLYSRLQRRGFLQRDVQRLVHQDRHVFGALMVHFGQADAMVSGLTRSYNDVLDDVRLVIDHKPNEYPIGVSMAVQKGKTILMADTSVHERPGPEILASIAIQAAQAAQRLGHEPRVAFLSYTNFGNPKGVNTSRVREAVAILENTPGIDFEFDGDMTVDVALNDALLKLYPFCRLTGPANVLVAPGMHSASIAIELLANLGQGHIIGPVLFGLEAPVQIVHPDANVSEIVTMAILAAHGAVQLCIEGKAGAKGARGAA